VIDVESEAPEAVTRAVAGDADAFGVLYVEHYPLVFRFILKRVSNRTLAEDLAADVFLRAFKRVNGFVWQGTSIAAWLLMISRNIVADYYRSPRWRKEILDGGGFDHERASDDFEARPDEVVVDHMVINDVTRLIPLLSPDQAEVLTLRFIDDLSLLETAEKTGRTEGAVKALQYRATRSLAKAWYAEMETRRGAA
jgi:RNA polymerase sigma-70 factor, ECF subfamily